MSKRILLLSDSPALPVSYANVVRNFAHELAERGTTVAFGSFQLGGYPLKFEWRGRTYAHYGVAQPYRIGDTVTEFDPDLIIHVRDPIVHIPRMFPNGNYSVKASAHNGAPCWTWVPVQHQILPYDYVDALHREYDVIMPFTRAGGEILGNAGVVRDRIEPLQLGVSDSYSDPEGPVAGPYGRDGVPIVMSVGLGHQDRKSFPMLMYAYREVMGEVDLDFYLHTLPIAAFDLNEHARMLGVDRHWLFPRGYDPGIGVTEESMAARYRRATAYASCGTGEGFDMPLSEACAMGRAVIFPADGNRTEVTGDYEGPRLPVDTFPLPRNVNWEVLMDPRSLAAQLRRVKDVQPDPAAGRRYYAAHSWPVVAENFMEIARRRGVL